MSGIQQLLLGGSPAGYQISRSLRFNSADSAYLNRTLTTPTDGKKWTWSGWVKRGILTNGTGTAQQLFSAGSATGFFRFSTTDTLVSGWTGAANLETTQVFRDASAWYHIMLVVDTTQATASNRVKYYVNGSQITAFSSTDYPTQNSTTTINSAVAHNIGAYTSSTQYFNGYMTEINFIDGQALTPSDFGETDSATGVWKPKAYTGIYGTNGFFLKFADSSGTTSTTLGKDSSGNGNNWTPNNFSVTAGAGNDSLVDTPTSYGSDTGVGGEVRGNYATLNPLDEPSTYASAGSSANGNLDFSVTNDAAMGATFSVSSGKWYWEMTVVSGHSAGANTVWAAIASSTPSSVNKLPYQSGSGGRAYASNGSKYNENTTSSYGNTYTNNDVIGCALDLDNGKVYWSKNGTWQNSGDPVAGTNAAFTGLSGTWLPVAASNAALTSFNFGQRPFAYTAPSGFKALCTQNLPTPTIGATSTTQAGKYMNVVLWTGANTNAGNSVTGVGFSPDFVWEKVRSQGYANLLYDRLRGTGATAELSSNENSAEGGTTSSERGYLNSFDSDGFSSVVGSAGDNLYFNQTSQTYVAWNWKANGAGSSNTAGSITSTVSANTTSGFSIVTYTGTGANGTVGHGLGVAPSMIIVKNRQAANSWVVYHVSIGNGNVLLLNSTNASTADATAWNNTSPTSTLFSLGTGAAADTNQTSGGGNHVAYCFASVAGYSAFGSYTGNGSTDGPFVYTGFRPRWVMFKKTSATSNWSILDTSRDDFNVSDNPLLPNTSGAESTSTSTSGAFADILSNGFKLRGNSGDINDSGATYIYAAFAEVPQKFSLAR